MLDSNFQSMKDVINTILCIMLWYSLYEKGYGLMGIWYRNLYFAKLLQPPWSECRSSHGSILQCIPFSNPMSFRWNHLILIQFLSACHCFTYFGMSLEPLELGEILTIFILKIVDSFYPAEFTPDRVLSSLYSYVRTYVRTSIRNFF